MLIIDPATGAMWKFETEYINATLEPVSHNAASVVVYDVKDISDEIKAKMVAVNTK